jgi:hypothetical protein
MKRFLLLPLVTMLLGSVVPQTPSPDGSQIAVLSFKWSKSHQTIGVRPDEKPLPARAPNQNDKNFDRSVRVNDPAGMRDPNADTLDARGAELEKNVRSASNPPSKTSDGFLYQAKIHNASKQDVQIIFWEYQFIDPANPNSVTRRQFLCGVNIKPDKDKELQGFSLSGPAKSINATSPDAQPQEKVVINRVEFADGKTWQRSDWNFKEILAAYDRAMSKSWSPNEMCRAL